VLLLEHLPEFLITTTVQSLPAMIALMAWTEGGTKILRQYGPRMLWELAGLVAVGIAFLLYASLRLHADDGPNTAIIVVTTLCAVPAVTVVIQRIRVDSAPLRLTLAAGVSYFALQAGLFAGFVMAMAMWTPTP